MSCVAAVRACAPSRARSRRDRNPAREAPQIKYFERGVQWTPRGDVLRCVVNDGSPRGMPIIHIDDQELSWAEFGRLLCTYAGWGMRIVFVPDDRLEEEPDIEVREADEDA